VMIAFLAPKADTGKEPKSIGLSSSLRITSADAVYIGWMVEL